MGREHYGNFDFSQPSQNLVLADTCGAHSAQGTEEGSRLSLSVGGNLRRAAAAFAMICLGEVSQLEVDGERFGHPMGVTNVKSVDNPLRASHQLVFVVPFLSSLALSAGLTVFD
jgi:hypothetical protein